MRRESVTLPDMGRPKSFRLRTKLLADRSVATYARFTDQHGVRHEPLLGYDLDPLKAERMLEHIKADVERGVWKPREPVVSVEVEDPTFWEFASDWWASKRKQELAARSEEWYEWALKQHLLPYAHDKRVSDFDSPRAVEELRDHLLDKRWPIDPKNCPPGKKPGSKRLSARSVNQVLSVLSAILASAWERGGISKNWAATKGKRAKVKKRAKVGNWVDYEPLVALLDAAHQIDLAGPRADTRNTGRRALLACLFLGAMRVSEAAQVQRRDVKWSRGVIQIPASKTAAGIARDVPMHRMLFDAMSEWWTRHPVERPDALLFPTATGRQRDRHNIRSRVLNPAITGAETVLRERKSNDSFPTRERTDGTRVTHVPSHSGRRTAITWWAEAGYDERDVMMWVGHEDPLLTLRLYRQARNRPRDPRVAAAMAEVPAKERRTPRHLRAA
jgi:integrase